MHIVFLCSIRLLRVKHLKFLNSYHILLLGKHGGKNLNMISFDCIDIFNYFSILRFLWQEYQISHASKNYILR